MSAAPNSFRIFVRDSMGQEFLHTTATNRPEMVASSKEHARWWISHRKRPAAHRDQDRLGRPIPSPIGRAEIVVEFYDDKTAR